MKKRWNALHLFYREIDAILSDSSLSGPDKRGSLFVLKEQFWHSREIPGIGVGPGLFLDHTLAKKLGDTKKDIVPIPSVPWKDQRGKLGASNSNNSCFCNSLLLILSLASPGIEWIVTLSLDDYRSLIKTCPFCREDRAFLSLENEREKIRRLLLKYVNASRTPGLMAEAGEFANKLQIRVMRNLSANDPHEFMQFLFGSMGASFLYKTVAKRTTTVFDFFWGSDARLEEIAASVEGWARRKAATLERDAIELSGKGFASRASYKMKEASLYRNNIVKLAKEIPTSQTLLMAVGRTQEDQKKERTALFESAKEPSFDLDYWATKLEREGRAQVDSESSMIASDPSGGSSTTSLAPLSFRTYWDESIPSEQEETKQRKGAPTQYAFSVPSPEPSAEQLSLTSVVTVRQQSDLFLPQYIMIQLYHIPDDMATTRGKKRPELPTFDVPGHYRSFDGPLGKEKYQLRGFVATGRESGRIGHYVAFIYLANVNGWTTHDDASGRGLEVYDPSGRAIIESLKEEFLNRAVLVIYEQVKSS